MATSDRISPANVILDLDASNKRTLLQDLAARAAPRLGLSGETVLKALQDREALGSTGLGRGLALPHARLPGDAPPVMLFARLRKPIDYEARDEEPVDLVILVLWPEQEAEGFLPALSDTCRALRDPQTLRQLRTADTAEEAARILNRDAGAEDGA